MATVTPPSTESTGRLRVCAGWPLARRAGIGTIRFGGEAMTRRMLDAAGVGRGARVVDLAPGRGATGALLNDADLHSYTAVCATDDVAAAVRGRIGGLERRTVIGTPDDTGLPGGEASAVIAETLLTGLSDPGKQAVLRETMRILRPGGCAAFHELAILDDPWARGALPLRALLSAPARGGLRPLDAQGWRDLVHGLGLEVVGVGLGTFAAPGLAEALRDVAVRDKPRVAARLLLPGRVAPRWRAVTYELDVHAAELASAVLVVRRPVLARP